MFRHIGLNFLALAVAQTLASVALAAPAPSGKLQSTHSAGLSLQPTLLLSTISATDASASSDSSTPSSNDSSSDLRANGPGQGQVANQQLALKLDTRLKKAFTNPYDSTAVASYASTGSDFSMSLPDAYSQNILFQSAIGQGSSSQSGQSGETADSTDLALKNLLPSPGRSIQPQSTGLATATDLTTDDLMRFLDEFASSEFASATMRAPIVINLQSTTADAEAALFLRPDVTVETAVPEPGTLALLASSLFALHAVRRRRQGV
ncbi:MAG: PEP-CTERM sorting domain-containing protein [Pseudomonadota bacterium]